ncbi:MAG: hypothetical protein JSR82_24305 [Verrucomicrobia bacterium]|nr:hypothetical protein [Verrucomicrobiota bacterium]
MHDPYVYVAHLSRWKRLKLALSTDPDDIPGHLDPVVELRRRRLLRAGLWMMLFMAIVGLGALPTYRAWLRWEARREAGVALSALAAGKTSEAWVAAQEAVRWTDTEPAAWRALAQVAASTERWDRAVDAWQEMTRRAFELFPGDRRAQAAALLEVGQASTALEALDALGARAEAPDQVLRARALLFSKRDREGVEVLSRVLRDSGTAPEVLLAAVRELMTAAEVARDDLMVASATVRRLAEGRGTEAFAAAQIAAQCLGGPSLDEGGLGEPLSARDLIQALRGLPSGGLPAKLLSFELEMRLDPAAREDAINAAVQEQARVGTSDALGTAAQWLLQRREAARVLELVPPERARESAVLGRCRIEALAAAGKLREARVEAEAQQYPIDPDIEQALLARILTEAGDPRGAERRWAAAISAAGQDRPRLRRLAELARAGGAELTAEAAEASVAALDRAAGRR